MMLNVSRVQNINVSQKRNRWLINLVMILGAISFLGFSIFPLLSNVQPQNQSAENTVATPVASPAAKQQELAAQAKGYELVLQREPENQTALKGLLEVRMAMVGLNMVSVKEVIDPLEKLVKLNPNDTEYAVLLAQAKQYTGDLEGAASVYRSVLDSRPGDIKALEGLVSLLIAQKRPEAAIGLLQDKLNTASKLNQVQPGTVDESSVKLLLASVYADQQRYKEAIALYDQAIKTNNQDFRPVLAKAIVLQKQGKTQEAKPLFTTAANLAPARYKDQINQLASNPTPATNNSSTTPAAIPSSASENKTDPKPNPNAESTTPAAIPNPATEDQTDPNPSPNAESTTPAAIPSPAN